MKIKLPDNVYLTLKWIQILAIPVCTFITSVVAAILTGETMAIITAVISGIGTLAGAIIKASDVEYQKELKEGNNNG